MKRFSAKEIDSIRELVESGEANIRKISRNLNLDYSSVRYHFNKMKNPKIVTIKKPSIHSMISEVQQKNHIDEMIKLRNKLKEKHIEVKVLREFIKDLLSGERG